MNDIQRYVTDAFDPDPDGGYVTYADHIASMEAQELRLGRHYEQVMKEAVQQAEQRVPKGYLWVDRMVKDAYEQGQRDALAACKRAVSRYGSAADLDVAVKENGHV